MKQPFIFIAALTLAFAAPAASAGDASRAPAAAAPEEQSLWTRETLTDDWFGLRPVLKQRGVTIDLSFTEYYTGLFEGGVTEKDFEFGGRADALIRIETGKLGLWQGGGFHVHVESRFGDSADRSSPRSGGLWPPNTGVVLPLGEPGRVVASSIYYSQKITDSATLMLGKINAVDLLAGDPFFGGWARDRFTNVAFVAPPSGVVPPTIIGGILNLRFQPLTVTVMAFDPNDRTNDYWPDDLFATGVNLSLGVTWSGKIAGRASTIGITGTYSTQRAANLAEILLPGDLKTSDQKGSYNVALSFSHLFHELRHKPGKGFGIYGKGAIADGNPNPIQASFVGGFAGHGVVPGRPHDVFGIGYYYYDFSDDLEQALAPIDQLAALTSVVPRLEFGDEQGMEAYYNFAVTPWFHLTADLQWISPARGTLDEAWVGGLRASIAF